MDTKENSTSLNINRLVEILRSIDETLAWIVLESRLIQDEFQEIFANLWNDTHERIEEAIRQLESVDSEDHEIYQALKQHGLTGGSLNLKAGIGSYFRRRVVESAEVEEGGPTILGFSLKPLVGWINLILGSLSKVLPILGAVKEYKECVELTVDQRKKAPIWNTRIFNF
jgi:hypothetical protein